MALDIRELDNWLTFEGSGYEVLDAYVVDTIKQNELMEDHKQYKSLLDYTDTTLLHPDQKFSSRTPNGWLKSITETGVKPQRDFTFWPKKGLSQREIWEKFTMSYLMTEWARKAKNLEWAPMPIEAELIDIWEQAKDLVQGYDITYAEEMVKVLTLGFSVTTAEGPGSACARDGLSLFNGSHLLKDGTTFSNLVTDTIDYSSVASGQTALQKALDLLKTMKFDNGKKIRQPKGEPYKLYCSRVRETYWLEVINNGSDKAGTGNNSAKENTFSFRNNLVQVVAVDLFGDTDADGNTIGTDNNWFLANPMAVKKMKALRCANLYSPRIKNFENDETDEINTSIRAIVGAGHYDAEFTIVWSAGTPSAS